MHKGFYIIVLYLIIFPPSSCIEPFKPDLNQTDLQYHLVVEGQLTDEPGPFKVRLTKSGPVYTYQDVNQIEPVLDAIVNISDDKGNNYLLNPTENGWYETIDKNLHGIPGNTYILHITDKDGIKYESSPEFMAEVPPIDSILYEEEQRTSLSGETVKKEDWLNILLNTHAFHNGVQYFKWEFEETWEFKMPEYIRVVKHIPGPPDCGCFFDSVFMNLIEISPEKLHCWISESSKSILVKSTEANLSGQITRFPLTSVGPEDDRLSIRYCILVKQYALNKDLFNYFKILRDLNETNGNIYDKIPAPVYGNILSLTINKKALGYFFASAVKTRRIFIDNNQVHIVTGHNAYSGCGWEYPPLIGDYYFYGTLEDGKTAVWSKNKYCIDCRERGTSVKPDFW